MMSTIYLAFQCQITHKHASFFPGGGFQLLRYDESWGDCRRQARNSLLAPLAHLKRLCKFWDIVECPIPRANFPGECGSNADKSVPIYHSSKTGKYIPTQWDLQPVCGFSVRLPKHARNDRKNICSLEGGVGWPSHQVCEHTLTWYNSDQATDIHRPSGTMHDIVSSHAR